MREIQYSRKHYLSACPSEHTSIWLSTLRCKLKKANGLFASSFNQWRGFIYSDSLMFLLLSVSVSHFLSLCLSGWAHCQLAAVLWRKPAGTRICVKLHRRRQGALSDILEEYLNSELFNVFLGREGGRQEGGYTGPIISPQRWCGWFLKCE